MSEYTVKLNVLYGWKNVTNIYHLAKLLSRFYFPFRFSI